VELLIGAIAYGLLLLVVIGIAIATGDPDLIALTSPREKPVHAGSTSATADRTVVRRAHSDLGERS